jgi:hypothetical protein
MADRDSKPTSKAGDLGRSKHEAEADFHGHAPYPSERDLEQRLASARGESAPLVEQPLPHPDPAQQ